MISNKSKRWIEAGKILAENPKEKILCPECEKGILKVKDIRGYLDPIVVERMIYCPSCRAKNYLRLRRPFEQE